MAEFDKKDTRGRRVVHAEPLMRLYTMHSMGLSTIILLYLILIDCK